MIIGIDLGSTNSLAAAWQDGKAVLIPNALGDFMTPSCVSLDDDGSVLVGRAARERLQTHPERTAANFKRFMGSNKGVHLGDRQFRPEELSSLVLRALKADAEAFLGQPIEEAVITVPAYFSDAQRKATRAAGQLAGLRVERLLNEPTAAAMAYGLHQQDAETRFLVFDLGGGTFDVSILEMFDGVMEVRASAGDNFLGGEDFLQALVDLFIERQALSGDLLKDRRFMQRLQAEAERAKRALSDQPSTSIRLEHEGRILEMPLDEALLEQACRSLLQRLRMPVERTLRDANLRSAMLDNIVLAGGATRMPVVRRLATTMFGRFPAIDFNPDEVVALGAAVQAGLKAKDAALREVVMTDVCPYSLGVAVSKRMPDGSTIQGHFDPVIERNTTVPVSRVNNYVPTSPYQSFIDLEVYQGESRMVRDNIHLGDLRIELPGLALEDSCVDVRFTYDVNGLLQVEAKVLKTNRTFSLLIEGNPGVLSEEDIVERLAAMDALKIHPRDTIENRTTLARAERVYAQMRGNARQWLSEQILQFEASLATQDSRVANKARALLDEQLSHLERSAAVLADDAT
ncbi:2-alkenal reductase [Delftia acidovorans SPH-1]|uniref:2-alkenal reductase n=1 Tax=Delftia acidovorans (strain DSM 14801 / SPH-1) TaxID=398578 RepID=A9C2Q7_DELAS|nr:MULTISPECIES: molecular chaperone HscC [Delftia]MBA4002103.1 molecular chaperone HscC [Delftia sp.]ABX36406.1 2-alkenal reductase [Delftia acidovorans SPH-1]MBN9321576.1 molecular chaperone HscC [Delftia acidovorans]MCP4018015.1 molecular chaperone HscC [Delftia sp.]MCP4531551.1 molecular chaperone HscC [Delftia sp.]